MINYNSANCNTVVDPYQQFMPRYQTAVPMQPQQPQQSQGSLTTVPISSTNPMDVVLNYPVGAGDTVIFIDFGSGVFWLKSTSRTGVPEPLRKFNFEEEIPQTPQNQNESNFVTKEDFNSLSDRLNALIDKLGGDK